MQSRLLFLEEPQHGIRNIGPNDLDRKGLPAGRSIGTVPGS
jgi:hypothetical protein